MDRRKSKLNNIVVQFDAIINETTLLKDNIDHVINQVYSSVEYIKETPEDLGQKSTEILKYELEVLTKLVDMNSMIENIWDLNLLDKWKIPMKKYAIENEECHIMMESNTHDAVLHSANIGNGEHSVEVVLDDEARFQNGILDTTPSLCHNPRTHFVPLAEEVELIPQRSHSRSEEIPQCNLPIETNILHNVSESQSPASFVTATATAEVSLNSLFPQNSLSINEDISQNDIPIGQIVRQQLKLLNEKYGINPTALSNMEDHYKKSNPANAEGMLNSPSHSYSKSDAQQIPERDTSELANSMKTTLKTSTEENFSYTRTKILPSYSSDSSEMSTDNSNYTGKDETVVQSTESSAKSVKIIEDSCSDHVKEQKHISLDSNPTINYFDSSSNHHLSDISKCSALKKLNNYEVTGKKEVETVTDELLQLPDISLKPTKLDNIPDFILENIDSSNKASKTSKKKNKQQTVSEKSKTNLKSDQSKIKKQNEHPMTVEVNLKSKQIPKVGDMCVFSHIESPSEFYLHIVDEETALIDKLNEQIDVYFKGTSSKYRSKEEAFNYIGKYCCAFITEYGYWFRVTITDWKSDDDEDVLVQLVDFGNRKMTSYKNLRKLTPEMSEMPMFAVRCHLPLMFPPGSTNLNRLSEWPCDSIEALYNLTGAIKGTNSIDLELVYVEKEPNSIAVDLQNPKNIDQDTVGQVLLNLGFAVQIVDNYEDDSDLDEFLQYTDDIESTDNVNEAVMGYDPRDEARICRFTKPDGTCFKGKHCKLDHAFLPQDGFTTDTEFVFREAFHQLCLPLPKETVRILITGYIDPCRFYAHVVRNPQFVSNYYMERDIHELQKKMNAEKMVRTYETFKISPAIGEMVLVKDQTKLFKRAVVREVGYANNGRPLTVQVFTLDYGETLTIDMIHVRKIIPWFLELPVQAIECYISDYKASTKSNPMDATAFFEKNLYFHNFLADVMSSSLPLKIKMTSLNGLNIGQILENYNFAEKHICDNNPYEDCLLNMY